MIKFHPTDKQLTQFAEGNIAATQALVISAHCDMCPQCQEFVQTKSYEFAQDIENIHAHEQTDPAFEKMLAEITALPILDVRPDITPRIELDGKFFDVPKPLQRYVKHTGN